VILTSVLSLELVRGPSRLAIALPDAVDEGSSLARPSILGSVIHVWQAAGHDLPRVRRDLKYYRAGQGFRRKVHSAEVAEQTKHSKDSSCRLGVLSS